MGVRETILASINPDPRAREYENDRAGRREGVGGGLVLVFDERGKLSRRSCLCSTSSVIGKLLIRVVVVFRAFRDVRESRLRHTLFLMINHFSMEMFSFPGIRILNFYGLPNMCLELARALKYMQSEMQSTRMCAVSTSL